MSASSSRSASCKRPVIPRFSAFCKRLRKVALKLMLSTPCGCKDSSGSLRRLTGRSSSGGSANSRSVCVCSRVVDHVLRMVAQHRKVPHRADRLPGVRDEDISSARKQVVRHTDNRLLLAPAAG